jgi:hypothetical protein
MSLEDEKEKNYDDKDIYISRCEYYDVWKFVPNDPNEQPRFVVSIHDATDGIDRQIGFTRECAKRLRDKLLRIVPISEDEYDPKNYKDL